MGCSLANRSPRCERPAMLSRAAMLSRSSKWLVVLCLFVVGPLSSEGRSQAFDAAAVDVASSPPADMDHSPGPLRRLDALDPALPLTGRRGNAAAQVAQAAQAHSSCWSNRVDSVDFVPSEEGVTPERSFRETLWRGSTMGTVLRLKPCQEKPPSRFSVLASRFLSRIIVRPRLLVPRARRRADPGAILLPFQSVEPRVVAQRATKLGQRGRGGIFRD